MYFQIQGKRGVDTAVYNENTCLNPAELRQQIFTNRSILYTYAKLRHIYFIKRASDKNIDKQEVKTQGANTGSNQQHKGPDKAGEQGTENHTRQWKLALGSHREDSHDCHSDDNHEFSPGGQP